ncbi:unnamed protein product [Lymnaea stagnalis]|uniref:Nucleoprotein TPR n=1 Tax=Lymnaea stagnalis TaxID=6523 RepID=A0AAV2IFY2_LYMST
MAGVTLSNELGDLPEIDQIPSALKERIEQTLLTKTEEVINIKSKYEKFRVNSEQQYFDLEKQLITTNGKLETESSIRQNLQEKLNELESKHFETTKKLQELQENREAFQISEHEFRRTIQDLENEKRDLTLIANKRNKEIERLNEEINELNKKLHSSNNEKCEAQARLNEVQSEQVSREYREKRLEKEKEQLEKQVEWFNEQLTEKTNQLSNVRKEKTSHVLEIQSQLEEKTQELEHLRAVVESLKQASEEQSNKMDALNKKLKDERDEQVQLEEQFRQELGVQIRLSDLYKMSAEENNEKVTELTGAVEEMRKLLKEASSAYTELEQEKLDEVTKLELLIKEKDETISKLQLELKNANDLMAALKKGAVTLAEEAVESLSPAAAATSKLLKSGMSLTQIYNEYVQATDALNDVREENKKLNSYLEQILQEIEEKAPLLKKQREDYETALTNLDQMSSQLDSTMLECEKLRADADDMRRRYGHLQRECIKYQQSSNDLGKQVRHLLKEVEELRGGQVVRDEMDVSSAEVSSSSNIITEKLVTFRNIEELQQQNQRLLEVCRELSEKKEQEENEATAEKTRELKDQLEFAMSELEHLKDARARQAELVESIVRQRDMYRVLLQQGGSYQELSSHAPFTSTPMPSSQPTTSTPGPAHDVSATEAARKELEDTKNALKELRAEFESYKKDKAEMEKLHNETLEKVRQNLADQRVANTKLSTQLDFATERYKIIQNNVAGYKKEIDLLQERNHQSASTILRHESAVAHLKEELMSAQENVARWQVQVENLKSEKELLKNAEKRLRMELESKGREKSSQSLLLASLQAIQNNQERAEFETRTRHANQVESLERELANLRRRLETSLEEKTKQATSWEDIVKTVHLEIKHEKEKQAALQARADNAVLELETVKQELSTCEAKLAAAEIKLENLSKNDDDASATVESRMESEALKDLKNQLGQQNLLIKSLRQQVEAAKKHANQYKTIADSVEQNLKEQAKVSQELQESCEKKVREVQTEKNNLAKRLELLEKDHEAALAENVRLANESASLHGDLRKQLSSLQHELEDALNQKQAAIANCEAAQEDLKRQADIASQAQDNYQRELMLHAADVEALNVVKKQLEDIQEHLQQTQEETISYEKQLTESKTSWAEQERILKGELFILETRCDELTKQNTVLHEQMARLSSQIISMQQAARRDSNQGLDTSFSDEQGKTSEQLLEVIRYLRREKDIAETKLQVVDSECKGVKQRFAHMERQVEESNKALAEERQKSQVNAETVANQVDLMRKVSHLNVLTDSNKLLRDERDQLLNNKQELESKIRQLQSDIEPLQNRLRELESEKESLTIERNTLQEDLNRWKNRTSNLIEQSNKTDPEEHKRLLLEKENLRKQLIQVREENFKQKNEMTRISNSNSAQATELNSLKQEVVKISDELTICKKQLEDKSKEAEEKTTTINRLKQIGRKYKEQAEKVTKEFEELKVKAAGQEAEKVATMEQTIVDLRNIITNNGLHISQLEGQLLECKNEVKTATKKLEQTSAENMSLKEEIHGKTQGIVSIQEDNVKLKTEVDDFGRKAAEFEKKLTQSRQVLQNARNKMMVQKDQMEKLESENKELRNALSGTPSSSVSGETEESKNVKALYEARLAHLQKELDEAKSAASGHSAVDGQLEKVQAENAEMLLKIQQLQRQLEAAQHKVPPPQQPLAARPASTVGPSTSSSDTPKTANIKPMATASSSSRQTVPITSHSPAAAKATASIRPMAISPTTPSLPLSGTPTATVMPTTASQHDSSDDNIPGPSGNQSTSSIPAASVTGRIQIVEPQVAQEWTQDNTGQTDVVEESSSNQAVVNPSVQETMTQVVNPTQVLPSTSDGLQSQHQHTTGVTHGKRNREEESFQTEEVDSKRTRMTTQEHLIPTITVIDENQQVVTQIQPSTSHSQGQVKPGVAGPISSSGPQGRSTGTIQFISFSTIIDTESTLKSRLSLQNNTFKLMMLFPCSEKQIKSVWIADFLFSATLVTGGYQIWELAGHHPSGFRLDMDESQQHEAQAPSTGGQSAQRAQAPSAGGPTAPRPPPPLQPIPHDRLPSVGRSQLTPFLLQAQGNVFDDDDCTVPSTPTLSQPRRGDGFAEALNSPAVPLQFLFGSEGENNPDLAQLESQRALGMDDTRMDLSQFDETGARSVPTTPVPHSAEVSQETVESLPEDSFPTTERGTEDDTEQSQNPARFASFILFVDAEEDALLEGDSEQMEGDGAPGDDEYTESADQGGGEGQPGSSRDDVDGGQDRSEGAAKPQIKKIVWDASDPSTSAPPSGPSPISTVVGSTVGIPPVAPQQRQPPQPQRRAQGLRRGGPTRGGRGSGPFWSGGPVRGAPFSPRGRGAPRGSNFRGF